MTDSVVNTNYSCSNPECRISETGKCIEGFESTEECPEYDKSELINKVIINTTEVDDMEAPTENTVNTNIRLQSSEALSANAASIILKAKECNIISIIGHSDAGKTSLIAAMYDQFQTAQNLKYMFSRSLTLQAFEQACHKARMASNRTTPDIDRTPRNTLSFFHLELKSLESKSLFFSLLLADRDGENYVSASNDTSVNKDFVEVCKSEVVTLLIDGEALLDPARQHNILAEVDMMIQAMAETGQFIKRPKLALVLTKFDLIFCTDKSDKITTKVNNFYQKISATYPNLFSEFSLFRIAASPKTDILDRGHGLLSLLDYWLLPKRKSNIESPLVEYKSNRKFHALRILEESEYE